MGSHGGAEHLAQQLAATVGDEVLLGVVGTGVDQAQYLDDALHAVEVGACGLASGVQGAHASIAKAPPIRGERALGWIAHYAIGVAFAGLLVGIQGIAWTSRPSLLPAIMVGAGTVVAPLCIMQPAMGAGFAAARTPAPLKNCLRSVANHTVFGLGLYLAAFALQAIAR